MLRLLYCALCLLLLVGCVTAPENKEKLINGKANISTLLIPSDYREVYYKKNHVAERYCRSPSPDFSVQTSDGLGIGVASTLAKPSEEKIGFSSGQSAFGLGGRSADVLLTRELMFRACELSANIDADAKTTVAIYNRFLTTVEKLSQLQVEKGTSASSASIKVVAPQEDVNINKPEISDANLAASSTSDDSPSGDNQSSPSCVEESDGTTPCTQTPGQACADINTGNQCWP